jgi:hypothetical protein
MDTTLTFRQERFVFECLKDRSASTAAARAGQTARNMVAQGSELMGSSVPSLEEIEAMDGVSRWPCGRIFLKNLRFYQVGRERMGHPALAYLPKNLRFYQGANHKRVCPA